MLKELQDLGLSEKEVRVYLALLQMEHASIQEVAKKADINRTTAYPVLETLKQKGLVSETMVEKKTRYVAEPPERLTTYVERQRVLFEEQAARLKEIVPQVKSLQMGSSKRLFIKYFEGRDGAISAYEEFWDIKEPGRHKGFFVINQDLLESTFTQTERDKFMHIRVGKQIEPTTVYTRKEGDRTFSTPGTRTRIDGDAYPFAIDMSVVGDKVVISVLGDAVSSVLIRSKEIATTFASLVQYINDLSKK